MPGWIKLHRRLLKNKLWVSEPFTKGQAWVDLLLLASYEDKIFWKRGIEVQQKRGMVGMSEIGLSDRWHWSRGKVRRFLKWLENEQQIVQQKSKVTTLIIIKNYDEYQQDGTTDSTTNGQQTDTTKKLKEVKEENKKEKNTKKENGNGFVLPDWVPKDEWYGYMEVRGRIKCANTSTAKKLLVGKLERFRERGHDLRHVLNMAIEHSWKSVYEPKEIVTEQPELRTQLEEYRRKQNGLS